MADSIERIANDVDSLSSRLASDRFYAGSPSDDMREIATRLRALSPAGGGDITGYTEALAHIRATMLAASPQQEPGADCALADESIPPHVAEVIAEMRQEQDRAHLGRFGHRVRDWADRLSATHTPEAHEPSGQTLAGAGGDGHVAYQLTEPGVRPCISAVIWNDETGKPGKGTHVWLTATSAGTTGDDSEDAARPKSREVARIGDMHPSYAMRVGFDGDGDIYVSTTADAGDCVEFCTVGSGGGKSPKTHSALIALMVAMEEDNAADPRRDWWAERNAARRAREVGNG